MSDILARLIERPVGPSFELGQYRVTRSTTHTENQEVFEFRYQSYSEAGFILEQEFPSGKLEDRFDSVAAQIIVRSDAGNLVGSTRFVRPSALGFHTETLFDFDLPPIDRMRIGEFGRLAVSMDHRGGTRLVMLAMLKAVFECMIESGTTHVIAFLPPKLADSFAGLGCKHLALRTRDLRPITLENRRPMKPYFENQRPIPVLYDLEDMLRDVGVKQSKPLARTRLNSFRPELTFLSQVRVD